MVPRTPEDRRRIRDVMDRIGQDSPWSEYRRLVLSELERINDMLDRIQSDLAQVKTDIELMKFKVSVWGVAAGAVSGAVVTVGAILLRLAGN